MVVSLSIVVPTYEEEANIGVLLTELQQHLRGVPVEYVVVDDDSPDGTIEAARAACPEVKAIVRTEERGLATAVVRGIAEATGDLVLVMDADLQHPPEVARRMYDAAVAENADLAVGTRYRDGGSDGGLGRVRKIISLGAATLSRTLLPPVRRHKVSDPMSGLFLVRRSVVATDELEPQGYKILLEIMARAQLETVIEVPYQFQPRQQGASKLGGMVIVHYLLHLLSLAMMHPDNRRIAKFMTVGLSGVGVNLGLQFFFTDLVGLYFLWGAIIGIELSILSNFLLNDWLTFHDRRHDHMLQRLAKFNAVSAGVLALNLATQFFLTEGLGLHYLVSATIAIGVAFFVGYAGHINWTYGGVERFRFRQAIGIRRQWLPLALVMLLSATVYVVDLDQPKDIYFDEHYYLSVAYQVNDGILTDPCWSQTDRDPWPLNFEHPPLAKLILAGSVIAFDGDHEVFQGCREPESPEYRAFTDGLKESGNPYAWRMPGVLFGLATILFSGLAAGRLFGGPAVAALAAGLVAMDGVIFTSSRVAILDIFAAGFTMAAVYAATFPGRKGVLWTALLVGLGFASKFSVLFFALPIFFLLLWTQKRHGLLNRRTFDVSLAAFIVLPALILITSYAPWWALWIKENGIVWAVQHWLAVMWAAVGNGTAGTAGSHPAHIPAWGWFTLNTPTKFWGFQTPAGVAPFRDLPPAIYSLGNPMLWWASATGAILFLERIVRRVLRRRSAGFVSLSRWDQAMTIAIVIPLFGYLAFMATTAGRDNFLFYMTAIVPFLGIVLAGFMHRAWRAGGMMGRIGVPVLLLGVAGAFLFYYPVLSSQAISEPEFRRIFDAIPWMDT